MCIPWHTFFARHFVAATNHLIAPCHCHHSAAKVIVSLFTTYSIPSLSVVILYSLLTADAIKRCVRWKWLRAKIMLDDDNDNVNALARPTMPRWSWSRCTYTEDDVWNQISLLGSIFFYPNQSALSMDMNWLETGKLMINPTPTMLCECRCTNK